MGSYGFRLRHRGSGSLIPVAGELSFKSVAYRPSVPTPISAEVKHLSESAIANRAALDAVVILEQGTDKHEKEVRSGDGNISQSDLCLQFGLGQAAKADEIVIRWPSGLVETLKDLPANRYYIVREGSGMAAVQTYSVGCVAIKNPSGESNWIPALLLRRIAYRDNADAVNRDPPWNLHDPGSAWCGSGNRHAVPMRLEYNRGSSRVRLGVDGAATAGFPRPLTILTCGCLQAD